MYTPDKSVFGACYLMKFGLSHGFTEESTRSKVPACLQGVEIAIVGMKWGEFVKDKDPDYRPIGA